MVDPSSDRIPRAPPYSRIIRLSTCTGLSPSAACLPMQFQFLPYHNLAGPISLATTLGVSFDFLSYRYLDVSVPCVRFYILCIHMQITISGWVSPFGYPRINAYSQLPTAFRSVSRPSSPLIAKASTKCPTYRLIFLTYKLSTSHHDARYYTLSSKSLLPAFNILHIKRCILYFLPMQLFFIIAYYSAFSLIHSIL